MSITAQNHTPDIKHADELVFTTRNFIWGWASWRRAWSKMDMNNIHARRSQYKFVDLIRNYGFIIACFVLVYWNRDYKRKNTSWDGIWDFRYWLIKDYVCLQMLIYQSIPVSLQEERIMKKSDIDPYTHIPFGSIKWPIRIPEKIEISKKKDTGGKKRIYPSTKNRIEKETHYCPVKMTISVLI
jgi:hypothetical protein